MSLNNNVYTSSIWQICKRSEKLKSQSEKKLKKVNRNDNI